jgi:S-adenosylmethionine:tRNA ribosyltransferase-isomerase
LKLSDFDYELPASRIAQAPLERRDDSRLMLMERASGRCRHHQFRELVDLLDPGDVLVLNDTRVLPARLLGRKESGGKVELLLLEKSGTGWRSLIQASRKPAAGSRLHFAEGLQARLLGRDGDEWTVEFEAPAADPEELLLRLGRMPLPPYIKRPEQSRTPVDDVERYQTVYARRPGAVAAPTAGLHFSDELLSSLQARGVGLQYLTLHVGLGTFLPVRAERIEEHRMHDEWYELPDATAAAIAAARESGGKVVAVGTTVARTLEWCSSGADLPRPGSGRCDLFIYPGYRFKAIDMLLTNFHLPCSTLLMLVSAFAGRERVLGAYAEAIAEGYRFYSYGDAMLIGTWE